MDVRKAVDKLRYFYVSIFLVVTFLILPSVTTVIFGMYSCQNIDPSGESNEYGQYGTYYLRRDYSIECSGETFYFGVVWASIMIIIYPFGLPVLNFWLLYKHRHNIRNRFEPENTNDDNHDYSTVISTLRILPDDTRIIEFLYRSYIPRLWYFECVETLRRLFLTAFISVIDPGSSAQLLVAIFTSLFFLLTYFQVKPYWEYGTSMLSQYALILVFVTYISTIFIGQDLLSENAASVITSLLTFGTVILIMLALFHEMNNYRGFLAFRRMYESDDDYSQSEDSLHHTGEHIHSLCSFLYVPIHCITN